MTEQELTNKIIKNANKQADALLEAAKAEQRNKIQVATLEAANRKEAALKKAKQDLAHSQEQLKKANEVEAIKARINAKQAAMTQAFDQVRDKLLHADHATVKKLVTALVAKYGTKGDTVLVAQPWAKAMPELPTTTAIPSGIIIENKTYRLELTVEVLLASLREKIGLSVAKILGVM